MKKIIPINKNTRIKIIPDNFMLQRKIKTRNKRIAWHTDGFFPDLITLSKEYLDLSPCRATEATRDFKDLIEVIKTAEANITKAIAKMKGGEDRN